MSGQDSYRKKASKPTLGGNARISRRDTKGVMTPINLRVLAVENDRFMGAQLLELDIAVRGSSQDPVLEEMRHALLIEYKIAKRFGRVPFVHLVHVPDDVQNKWREDKASSIGRLDPPLEVREALASVLHTPTAEFTATESKIAA